MSSTYRDFRCFASYAIFDVGWCCVRTSFNISRVTKALCERKKSIHSDAAEKPEPHIMISLRDPHASDCDDLTADDPHVEYRLMLCDWRRIFAAL